MTLPGRSLYEHGGESAHAFSSLVCDLFDNAVALMALPRAETRVIQIESTMLTVFPMLVDALAQYLPSEPMWRERLSRAHERLRQSGVLEKRGLSSEMGAQARAENRERIERADQKRAAAAASGQLKSCAMAGCGAREAHVSHFGKCSACKAVAYCCKEHQLADWPAHKAACKAARRAAAAAKDAA